MESSSVHCPFLNRTDERCARHFSLDHLQHAFKFCFGSYKACPVYLELLVERRVRRGESAVIPQAVLAQRMAELTAESHSTGSQQWRQASGGQRLVQVTIGQNRVGAGAVGAPVERAA